MLWPSPAFPKENAGAVVFVEDSFASSPCPTRSPEKLPNVSPPAAFRGCGSVLEPVTVEPCFATSPKLLADELEDPLLRPGEFDLVGRENGSSPVWPNNPLPFPPMENLFTSFPAETKRVKLGENMRGKSCHDTTQLHCWLP